MKNRLISKILLIISTVISILSLGFFNFYMSSYYNNISNSSLYPIDPCVLFFIILLIVFIQLKFSLKLMNNK